MTACLDASVVLAYVAPHELNSQAWSLVSNLTSAGEDFVWPPLGPAEITSALRVLVYDGFVDHAFAITAQERVRRLGIKTVGDPALHTDALVLARRLGVRRAYDEQYLALAMRWGADLWTADTGFAARAARIYPAVHHLTSFGRGRET